MTARKAEKDKEAAEKEEAVTTTERAGRTENGKTLEAQSETEAYNWKMVVNLVQSAFREGKLA